MENATNFMYKKEFDKQRQRHFADNNVPANPLRTSSIFHFTKSLDSLIGILSDGLIPNYCKETLYNKDEINITYGIPMVSFCDIPLSRTYEHTMKYGYFAIGLGLEYAEQNNINPLFYILLNDKFIQKTFPSVFSRKAMRAKTALSSSYLGLLKRVYGEFNKQEINNYAENEWRYIVPPNRKLKWFYSKEEYTTWRGAKISPKPDPMQNPILMSHKLTFSAKDLNHIIVEFEKDIPLLINHILNASQIGGSQTKLSNQDQYYLINHVTSFERIRRDY